MAAEMGLVEDLELDAYVSRIGERLARHVPIQGFEYHFRIVDQDVANAFALPGGFIFVSRGLLLLSDSEAQLANVLAHEIVHVARRHAAARQSLMRDLPGLIQFAALGQFAAYTRSQEVEADGLGQQLAARSGFDPQGLADFLRALEFTERLRIGHIRMPGFFDTHPTTSERVAAAAARARALGWQSLPELAPDRGLYLRRLDGLVVGMGAAEGVFQRDRFLHADLGFSMRLPEGWDVINTRRAVGALAPTRDAQVALELQGEGDDPAAAAREYLEEAAPQGLVVLDRGPVQLGEFAAYRARGRAASPRSPVAVHITWIAREGRIYRLTGAARGRPGPRDAIFVNVARSFRPITARERRSIRETRLRIVPAEARESVAALSQRTGNVWDVQYTAVVNGVYANATFEADHPVKIAVSDPYAPEPEGGP